MSTEVTEMIGDRGANSLAGFGQGRQVWVLRLHPSFASEGWISLRMTVVILWSVIG